jgi:hypothetical protein
MDRLFEYQSFRRFGVEVELNTLSGLVKKLEHGQNPYGSQEIALTINKTLKEEVEIQGWDHNYNNDCWIVKPDSSCGIEVCTPVLKGWHGLKRLIKVIEAFKEGSFKADGRCSLHVHVNIADLTKTQLASVIAWYIKFEHIFLDSVPQSRKLNKYCQMLGMTDIFYDSFPINEDLLISGVSGTKYYSLNAYHFLKGGGFDDCNTRKKTIEFRIGESDLCLDGFAVKNWVRFLLHFVEITKNMPLPKKYVKGDPWSGLLWLDIKDLFSVLKFDQPCSEGLNQIKNWFLDRVGKNGYNTGLPGVWSNNGRKKSRELFLQLNEKRAELLNENEERDDLLFGRKYIK